MVVVVQPVPTRSGGAKLRRNRNLVKMKLLRPLLQGSAFGLVFVDVGDVDDELLLMNSQNSGMEFGAAARWVGGPGSVTEEIRQGFDY